MPYHTVRQGECIESIADQLGLNWERIWSASENRQLRERRADPTILKSGDVVFIPDSTPKFVAATTEKRHRFKRIGVPSLLEIVLEDESDKPLMSVPYVLEIDGLIIRGSTDRSGRIQHRISPSARSGRLSVGEDQKLEYSLSLGHLDPIDEISGIQGRLNNIGFDCGTVDGVLGDSTKLAIKKFQLHYDLEVTGELDFATRERLQDVYGR